MSDAQAPPPEKKSTSEVISDAFEELGSTLVAFVKAPRALWGINVPYIIEGLAYFGLLTILGKFGSENCELTDEQSGWVMGCVTGGITFSMLIFGGVVDKIGVRLAMILSLTVMAVGRSIIALSDTVDLAGGWLGPQFFVMSGGLLLMLTAYGLYQPAAYAGVKRYTNPQTSAIAYSVVYGLMNLGAFFSGLMSPHIRDAFSKTLPPNGLASVIWVYAGLTLTGVLATVFILTRRTDRNAVEQVAKETAAMKAAEKSGTEEDAGSDEEEKKEAVKEKVAINNLPALALLVIAIASFVLWVWAPWVAPAETAASVDAPDTPQGPGKLCALGVAILFGALAVWDFLRRRPDHPFWDVRFVFFIFVLIPVQTLFAHNWLTLPYYLDRAFAGSTVGKNFEFFANLNPILIFVLAPVVAGLTARANIYKMMIIGTFVMAAPTFLLTLGPNLYLLISYILLMSVGEAMWQPRFLQWIAEIAPEGKTGAYMGIGQLPWFLTKMVTATYSGYFVATYVPMAETAADGSVIVTATNTGEMWFYYGLIAMISPIALIAAKGWMKKGMKEKAA